MSLSFNSPTIEWLVQVWECGRAFPRTYIEKDEVSACHRVNNFKKRLYDVPSITLFEPDGLTLVCVDTLSMNLVGVITAYPAHFYTPSKEAFATITGSREGPSKGFTKR